MVRTLSKWMLRLVWLVWLAAMMLTGVKLALDNAEKVQVTLFVWQTPELSLGMVLCIALLSGVVIGWLASSGPYFIARQKARRLQKRLSQSEREAASLRAPPIR